jgi:hypothetical protein
MTDEGKERHDEQHRRAFYASSRSSACAAERRKPPRVAGTHGDGQVRTPVAGKAPPDLPQPRQQDCRSQAVPHRPYLGEAARTERREARHPRAYAQPMYWHERSNGGRGVDIRLWAHKSRPVPPAVSCRDNGGWPTTAVPFPRWSPTEILGNSTRRVGSENPPDKSTYPTLGTQVPPRSPGSPLPG